MIKRSIQIFFLSLLVACGVQDSSNQKDGIADGDHRIFVTMTQYDGNLGGLSGADSYCSQAASSAGLERTYRAILSTDTVAAESRLNITGAVYIFSDDSTRSLVAASGIDFWGTDTENLRNTISISELYTVVSSNVWTGTTSEGGTMGTQNCNEWQSSSSGQNSFYGSSTALDSTWVENSPESCNNINHLYCISI